MKKIILFCLLSAAVCVNAHGQWTTAGTDIYNSNSGNVGIGTGSPTSKIHIISQDVTYPAMSIQGRDGAFSGYSQGLLVRAGFDYNDYALKVQNVRSDLGTHDAFIITGLGNVGIGTTTPCSRLTISGGFITAEGNYATGGYKLVNSSGSPSLTMATGNINSSNELLLGDLLNNFSSTGIFAGGGEAITILSDGKVGIGTTSPSQKLSIAGNISADGIITTKKMIVTQLGWSDYVFHENYKLRSLTSLEAFQPIQTFTRNAIRKRCRRERDQCGG